LIVAVDFDGTLVEHEYPAIGAEVEGAFDWLLRFQGAGVKLILWTMRSDQTLAEAVEFCAERGVAFWGINENPEQSWSTSPKQYANLYIDDAAVGCPLLAESGRRPFVDWYVAGPMAWSALGLASPHPAST